MAIQQFSIILLRNIFSFQSTPGGSIHTGDGGALSPNRETGRDRHPTTTNKVSEGVPCPGAYWMRKMTMMMTMTISKMRRTINILQ